MTNSHTLAFRTKQLDATGSTNDDVLDAAASGEAEGLVIVARKQTGGRGRRGRSWSSPEGNLYASLLLRPKDQTVAGQYSFVAALAIAEVLAEFIDRERIRLKWPNDVLADGAKIAGILLETAVHDHGLALVVGMGVNLSSHPDNARLSATSLLSLGFAEERLKPDAFLAALLKAFNRYRQKLYEDGFSALRELWLAQAVNIGEIINVHLAESQFSGRFLTIDDQGCLLLQQQEGMVRRIAAGDIFPVRR